MYMHVIIYRITYDEVFFGAESHHLRPLKQIKALKRKCQEELHAMMKCQEEPIGRNGWEMDGK